jgi:hypothetical protein
MPTRADYAKINIACKELGLDKYQLIADRYGIDSSKELTAGNLADLYTHFRSLGWRVKRPKKSCKSQGYKDPQRRKVVAMWITLSRSGQVKNSSDQALQAFVKRVTGVDSLSWCTVAQCNRVIEALKQWTERKGVKVE